MRQKRASATMLPGCARCTRQRPCAIKGPIALRKVAAPMGSATFPAPQRRNDHRFGERQPRGPQRVGHVQGDGVPGGDGCRNPALGELGTAGIGPFGGNQLDPSRRSIQGCAQSGGAAADDQDV